MMKNSLLFCAGLLLLAGCASEPAKKIHTPGYGEVAAGHKFEKIRDARLELVFVGPKTMKAGQKGRVLFSLKNIGQKTIRIEEWRMHEPDNLQLECQVWLPGQKEPDPDRWLPLDMPVKEPELRYNLELFPGTQAQVARDLDFVEDLIITPGLERRYFIRAKLNLTSVQCASPVAAFSVTSAN